MGDVLAELLGSPTTLDDLRSPQARRVSSFLSTAPELKVKVAEVRRNEKGHDILVLDLQLDLPQRRKFDIRSEERVAAIFGPLEGPPSVFPLRADFPAAPHTNDTPPGIPLSLCLYREPWTEIRLSWTAASFVQRIRWWLETTAEGGLYGGENPVEPLFFQAPKDMIVGRGLFERLFEPPDPTQQLQVKALGGNEGILLLETAAQAEPLFQRIANYPLVFAVIRPPVVRDGRVRAAPQRLGDLIELFREFDFDFSAELAAQLQELMPDTSNHPKFLCLLVPARFGNAESDSVRSQLLAFMSVSPVAEIAVRMGGYEKRDGAYGRILVPPFPEPDVDGVELMPVNVGIDVDQAELANLSGYRLNTRPMVMVGAGTLGSGLFDCFVRQGFGQWTLVDHDSLKPHNLARHALARNSLGANKARALASRSPSATARPRAIPADVLHPNESAEELQGAFGEAELIVDATASAAAARVIAMNSATAPRVSAFFIGDAKAIVVLAEDRARTARIDDLEAAFVAMSITDDRVAAILASSPTHLPSPASCRAPTSRAPWNRAVTFAGLAAETIRDHVDTDTATIVVHTWKEPSAAVDTLHFCVQPFEVFEAGDWSVRISGRVLEDLRTRLGAASPRETGGALFGSVDQWNRIIHIAAHFSDLEDSVGTTSSFQRGLAGFPSFLESVSKRTRGAIVYVGEWHSHPPGHSAAPSETDILQLAGLSRLLVSEGRPAVSLILAPSEVRVLVSNVAHQQFGAD